MIRKSYVRGNQPGSEPDETSTEKRQKAVAPEWNLLERWTISALRVSRQFRPPP